MQQRLSRCRRLAACALVALAACTKIGAPSPSRMDGENAAQELPCAVGRVLRTKCVQCHGHPPSADAPLSLTSWSETHLPAQGAGTAKVFERIAARIHDAERPMPPRGQPQLTDDELSTLDIWLQAGAPASKDCATKSEPVGAVAPPDAGPAHDDMHAPSAGDQAPHASSSAATPASADAGSPISGPASATAGAPAAAPDAGSTSAQTTAMQGSAPPPPTASDLPVPPRDDECEYVDLLAQSDKNGSPYKVAANANDEYRCFIFDRNLDTRTQALAFLPMADNVGVMQHWVLYALESFGSRDAVVSCDYTPGYKIIAGGAPGTDPWYLPADVGVDVGRGLFMLEVHYNNPGKPETTDRSGVRVCLSKQPRPKVATVSWLGVERLSIPAKAVDYNVSNRCRPTSREPIHLLRYWPHMNRLGTRSALRVERSDGTSETLHNATYSLQAQKTYAVPYVLQPGESLLATCYYNNPNDYAVSLGLKASDEMCNHFVLAYPALALTNDAPSAWNDACLGAP